MMLVVAAIPQRGWERVSWPTVDNLVAELDPEGSLEKVLGSRRSASLRATASEESKNSDKSLHTSRWRGLIRSEVSFSPE